MHRLGTGSEGYGQFSGQDTTAKVAMRLPSRRRKEVIPLGYSSSVRFLFVLFFLRMQCLHFRMQLYVNKEGNSSENRQKLMFG